MVCRFCLLLAFLKVAIRSELGSDPFNVLVQGLYRCIPWPGWMTYGQVHLSVCLIIVIILMVTARSYIRIGTVLCMALGGPIIDLWSNVLSPLFREGLPMAWRLLALVLGCVILSFGMTIVIRSEAGTGPNDLVAVVISDKHRKPLGPVRVVVDLSFALTGWLLGGTIGIGTLVCVGVVGPCAQIFIPISGRICDRCIKHFGGSYPPSR